MSRITQALLVLLAAAAIVIGTLIFTVGPHRTASLFGAAIFGLAGLAGYEGGLATPDISSELRFYAVLWIAYGVVLLRAAWDIAANRRLILILLGLFLAGGIGRVIGWTTDGPPALLFRILTVIECALPVLLAPLVLRAQPRSLPHQARQ